MCARALLINGNIRVAPGPPLSNFNGSGESMYLLVKKHVDFEEKESSAGWTGIAYDPGKGLYLIIVLVIAKLTTLSAEWGRNCCKFFALSILYKARDLV